MFKRITVLLFFIAISQGLMASNLADLIQMAINQNIELKTAELEIEKSIIDEEIAHSAMLPNLYLSGNRTFSSFHDNYQRGLNPAKNTWAFSLRLSQTYPGLGKIPSMAKEIAKIKTDIISTYKHSKQLSITGKLVKLYFELLKNQELRKIHELDLLLIDKLLDIAKLNEEVGLVLHNDILRIEVEKHNSNSNLIKAKSSYKDLMFDLASILDEKDPENIEVKLPMSLRFAVKEESSSNLINTLFDVDYSINLAKSDLQILDKIVSSASKAKLPTLSFNSTYKYGNKYGSDKGGKDNKDLVTTFELSTPVYDGNEIRNMVKQAKKSAEIGKLTLENLFNNKRAELEKAVNDYKNTTARIGFVEKMVEQSNENMQIILLRYQEGASSITELIDAQRLFTNSLQTAVSTYYDERTKLAEIYLLTHQFDEIDKMDNSSLPINMDVITNLLITEGDK